MERALKQIYVDGVPYSQAQQICRELLFKKIGAYKFQNAQVRTIVEKLAEDVVFPLEYGIVTEETTDVKAEYKNIASGLFFAGAISGIVLLITNFSSDLCSLLAGVAVGVSVALYKGARQTSVKTRKKLMIPSESLVKFIDETYKTLILLDNVSWSSRTIHNELLVWFQKMHSWASRDVKRSKQKEDIEDIMMKFGYEFCEYSQEDADFFDATNANVESTATTIYALMNANNHEVILRGKVVFPLL